MTLMERPTISDAELIGALVASHGSLSLAAERLKVTPQELVERLPTLPYEQLTAGIKAARLLSAFDSFTIMKDVIVNTLPDLSASERAKFMIQFMDRLEVMLNPPVHGGSGQAGNPQQFNFNIGSPEAAEDTRAALTHRLIEMHVEGDGSGEPS